MYLCKFVLALTNIYVSKQSIKNRETFTLFVLKSILGKSYILCVSSHGRIRLYLYILYIILYLTIINLYNSTIHF